MPQDLGVGLIGYGAIGRVHALCYRMLPICYPQLAIRPQLAAVLVATPEGVEKARRELEGVRVFTRLNDFLGDPDVALVDCCAPTADHAVIARATLEAQKPLFCEKPLAVDPVEAAALAALADERGLVCGVNYHFRCVPALQEAKRWIDDGGLGEVISFHMRYYRASNLRHDRPVNWRFQGRGSGVLIDLGSHLVDLTQHLLGPITSVAAQTRTLVEERPDQRGQMTRVESDDAAWMTFELAGGGRGSAHVSKVTPGAADDVRVEAYGMRGTLVFDTADPNGLMLANANGQRRVATWSKVMPTPTYPSAELVTAPVLWHLTSIAAYIEDLAAGRLPAANFAAAARVDAVIAAALDSASHNNERRTIT